MALLYVVERLLTARVQFQLRQTNISIVRSLHVFGYVLPVPGPLAARHVQMRRLAAGTERFRHVALHRAVQADRAEAVVRVHVRVCTGRRDAQAIRRLLGKE